MRLITFAWPTIAVAALPVEASQQVLAAQHQ